MARRALTWSLCLSIVVGVFSMLAGCTKQELESFLEVRKKAPRSSDSQASLRLANNTTFPPAVADRIRIAAFNIQVLGQSKLAEDNVMQILADTVRRFDIVAIQELRSKEQNVIPEFLKIINSGRVRYASLVGPRLGRTSSKEQYVFLYDTERIEPIPNSVETIIDPQDLLHRPPLFARFRVRGPDPREAFNFTLINIHTDPDETDTELDALADVYQYVRERTREDDVILLGDLNVDYQHLGRLGSLPWIVWTVEGETTNTRRTASYDNILFDRRATTEFTGRAGVFDLRELYGLSEKQALEVSDHFPVWAEFSVYENGRALVATRPE